MLFFRAVGQGDSLNNALVCAVDDVAADGVEVDTRCLLAGMAHALADDADGDVQVACDGGPRVSCHVGGERVL